MQQTAQISVESLNYSDLGDITKALFESKMAMDGFKVGEYILARGWDQFQAAFEAKQLLCWWPHSLQNRNEGAPGWILPL